MNKENNVISAVRIAGGPSRVAAELRVSSRAVNTWQNKGYVPKYDYAQRLAALVGVPVATLRKTI
jgi:hypothetical protein